MLTIYARIKNNSDFVVARPRYALSMYFYLILCTWRNLKQAFAATLVDVPVLLRTQ